jgi:hypothetical protein
LREFVDPPPLEMGAAKDGVALSQGIIFQLLSS